MVVGETRGHSSDFKRIKCISSKERLEYPGRLKARVCYLTQTARLPTVPDRSRENVVVSVAGSKYALWQQEYSEEVRDSLPLQAI